MNDNKVILFHAKSDCCGCGACMNICPNNAIKMVEDEVGFLYPQIDHSHCISCYACKRVCAFQNKACGVISLEAFAAANEDVKQNTMSSSGGVFAAIATVILSNGGVVYGAGYLMDNTVLCLRVDKISELHKLQGSKYVQSDMQNAYKEIENDLKQGNYVLFSGTPCQVAAVKSYLGKEYNKLLTIDIICHGVPSQKMLKDYLSLLGDVSELVFRDKKLGWEGYYLRYMDGRKYHNIICHLSSYYAYFLQGALCRDSCYVCKYADQKRYSDITIGDYWGIRQSQPELLEDDWWKDRLFNGISCVLVNSEKGIEMMQNANRLRMVSSDYERISKYNGQLRQPIPIPKERSEILNLYEKSGWVAVDKAFFKNLGLKQRAKYQLKSIVPVKLKRKIKRILKVE